MEVQTGYPETRFAEVSSLRIKVAGMYVTVSDDGDRASITCNPVNAAFVTQLDVQEVAIHNTQARLVARGVHLREDPEKAFVIARVEIANVRDRLLHHRFKDPVAGVDQELAQLSMFFVGLEA